jgi:hypothetical protein
MRQERSELDRRDFLKTMLGAGLAGGAGAMFLVRQVLAMGQGGQLTEGVRKVQGDVSVNGAPAQVGSIVFPGDVITTGSASLGVFVIGADAFLVRENSRIELAGGKGGQEPGATKLVTSLKISSGKVLSVFGTGGKRIETVTAVAGTRGTGVYVESEPDLTYFCLCYGAADLSSAMKPDARESFSAEYHEARYILPPGAGRIFLKAPKINHRDEELVMLEALVGRKVPSAFKGKGGSAMSY